MPHATLAATLQALVDKRGLSVTAIARGAGLQQPTLHRYTKGEVVRPDPRILAKLAKYFGCSVDSLLDGSAAIGPSSPPPTFTVAEVHMVVTKVLAATARRGITDPDTIAACVERGLMTIDAFRDRDARDQSSAIDGALATTLS